MTYRLLSDRHSGGFYGEEDETSGFESRSDEETEDREESGEPGESRRGRRADGADEMEELCW